MDLPTCLDETMWQVLEAHDDPAALNATRACVDGLYGSLLEPVHKIQNLPEADYYLRSDIVTVEMCTNRHHVNQMVELLVKKTFDGVLDIRQQSIISKINNAQPMSFADLAMIVVTIEKGWKHGHLLFYATVPTLFVALARPVIHTDIITSDQYFRDILVNMVYRSKLTLKRHPDADMINDKMRWVRCYQRMAIYLDKQIRKMSTEEWCRFTTHKFFSLSVVCMASMLTRSITLTDGTSERYESLLTRYAQIAQRQASVEPTLLK